MFLFLFFYDGQREFLLVFLIYLENSYFEKERIGENLSRKKMTRKMTEKERKCSLIEWKAKKNNDEASDEEIPVWKWFCWSMPLFYWCFVSPKKRKSLQTICGYLSATIEDLRTAHSERFSIERHLLWPLKFAQDTWEFRDRETVLVQENLTQMFKGKKKLKTRLKKNSKTFTRKKQQPVISTL